jgi:hypothetical protein
VVYIPSPITAVRESRHLPTYGKRAPIRPQEDTLKYEISISAGACQKKPKESTMLSRGSLCARLFELRPDVLDTRFG